MPKIFYKDWNANAQSLKIVDTAESIIEQYASDGYTLTLRQLYYQFVSRDLIENSERSYKNLGNLITKARTAGMIDWNAIEDRNREYKSFWYEEDETRLISNLQHYIRFNRWKHQENYVEVWVEKEALGNVIKRACDEYQVPYMSCKGYLSASEAWRAGRRFEEQLARGKNCTLIHLGDHDPSGIDMTRDNQERLDLFAGSKGVDVRRIALNMDQVEDYSPPPNPAKITDTRSSGYIKKFGNTSWELDALEPSVIVNLILGEVENLIDFDEWDTVNEEEDLVIEKLRNLYNQWDDIKDKL